MKVIVADGYSGAEITYEYIVVCDSNRLRGFDLNFLVLFAMAVGIIVLAVKTPQPLIFNDMTDEEREQTDLKLSQAVCFFVMSSFMLLFLYLFLEQVKGIFTLLITVSCVGCISIIVEDFLMQGLRAGTGLHGQLKRKFKLPLIGEVTQASLIGTGVGVVLSATWYFTGSWILNNVLAFFLALTFLKTLRLTTLTPGLVLLGLLFFYDIFWVFLSPYFTSGGKSVMVAVATGLDIPIKLVMPHLTNDYPTTGCSLLGLGDILVPGIFIIFMARFGFEVVNTGIYFHASLAAYVAALLMCGASLFIFHAAQPALLYIVPALFGAAFGVGRHRGELRLMVQGIPKQPLMYRNQALSENDPFGSTIREIEKGRNLGGTAG